MTTLLYILFGGFWVGVILANVGRHHRACRQPGRKQWWEA